MKQIPRLAIQLGGSTGRKLRWDPEKERFDDPAANRLLDRPRWRAPWTLRAAQEARHEPMVFIGLAPARFVNARQEDLRRAGFALVELCALSLPESWPQLSP